MGDERIHPRSSLTPARPLPWGAWLCPQGSGASLPLPPPSLTLGTLSNCTKVAVCQSYPHTRVGSLLPVLSPHCLCSRPGQSPCSPVFLDSSALCVCVCVCLGGGGGSGRGLGRARGKMADEASYPLPQLQATEAWEGGCLLSLPCVLQMCQNGDGGGGGCLAEQPPGWLSQSNTVPPAWGTARQGRGLGWGPGGSLCTAVYIQGCSLSGTRCGRLCVCEPPLPLPCMTCDAADTTILCAVVCWGQ